MISLIPLNINEKSTQLKKQPDADIALIVAVILLGLSGLQWLGFGVATRLASDTPNRATAPRKQADKSEKQVCATK